MPTSFGLGYQDLPDLEERIKIMRRVLHGHAQHEVELAKDGTFSDGRVTLFYHAEETIRQVHRELALRSLHTEKNTRSAVEVFETLKTWRYLEKKRGSDSINIRTVVNDLDVAIVLLAQAKVAHERGPGEMDAAQPGHPKEKPSPKTIRRGRPSKFSAELKMQAANCKAKGGTGKQIAIILYKTQYPTDRQVKDAPKIVKYFVEKTQVE